MRTSQNTLETISTIGIDVGKNTFHLVGLDKRGAIVLQRKVTRHQLTRRLSPRGRHERDLLTRISNVAVAVASDVIVNSSLP